MGKALRHDEIAVFVPLKGGKEIWNLAIIDEASYGQFVVHPVFVGTLSSGVISKVCEVWYGIYIQIAYIHGESGAHNVDERRITSDFNLSSSEQ